MPWTCDDGIHLRIHSTIGEFFLICYLRLLYFADARGKIPIFAKQPAFLRNMKRKNCFFFHIFFWIQATQKRGWIRFCCTVAYGIGKLKSPLFSQFAHNNEKLRRGYFHCMQRQLKTYLFLVLSLCVCVCLTENSLVANVLVSIRFIIKSTLFARITSHPILW